ncbi:hypothetical protein, partial [Microvirga massiliensis]|uniref:hypothetical protein n=1 Tax=Microvirga massiliensis TaxID=1033741 RepID=UPI00066078FB
RFAQIANQAYDGFQAVILLLTRRGPADPLPPSASSPPAAGSASPHFVSDDEESYDEPHVAAA